MRDWLHALSEGRTDATAMSVRAFLAQSPGLRVGPGVKPPDARGVQDACVAAVLNLLNVESRRKQLRWCCNDPWFPHGEDGRPFCPTCHRRFMPR